MKTVFSLMSLCLISLLFSACGKDDLPSLLPKPADKATLYVSAPVSGGLSQKKTIDCDQGKTALCERLPLLLEQLEFPKRAETASNTLNDDLKKLRKKARFSSAFKSTRGETSIPPKRSDTYSFPVFGGELTVMISGSVAEVKNTLVAPSGNVYEEKSFAISHDKTPYIERFIIPNPERGTWKLVSNNISSSQPVYIITFETFVTKRKEKARSVRMRAEVLDDGEVILSASDPLRSESFYEWDMGDGFIGEGPVVGHNYQSGKYVPQLLILRDGVGEEVLDAPFFIRQRREELAEVIAVNEKRQQLPSPPRILSAKEEGNEIVLRALPGNPNGGDPDLVYEYSIDAGGDFKRIEMEKGIFRIPKEEGVRLLFRAKNSRGAGVNGLLICNFSGYYPLEAKAKGIVKGKKIDLYLRSGGCPGERWNIIAPLWKEAGIF